VQQLLALSVWGDLRNGGQRADLLVAAAPRLGFRRVLLPTTGPLAGPRGLLERVVAKAPVGLDVSVCDPHHAAVDQPLSDGRIPTWLERDLLAMLQAAGPVPGRRLSVDLPVALGRTAAEATARAASDPVFGEIGAPLQTGLFGRLEDVQAQVARLAAAGAAELCCFLPAEDLLDHLAQLTTVAIGHLDTHAAGLRRSPDPSPPSGWGGRSGP
jgi:hypothetical protein